MDLLTGTVHKIAANRINVICNGKSFECFLPGRFKKQRLNVNKLVTVGDLLDVRMTSDSQCVIENIRKRKNVISRPDVHNPKIEQILVSNIDQLLIIQSAAQPIFTTYPIDRSIVIAEKNNITPVICINKIDLVDVDFIKSYIEIYKRMEYHCILTSALKCEGIARLSDLLSQKTTMLIGQSGVGKTSLINVLQPQLNLKTRQVSQKIKRGKHTTSWVEMIQLDSGGFVIDTPGIDVFGLWNINKNKLPELFRDFKLMQGMCKFKNCLHYKESLCAIKIAVADSLISEERYKSYIEILKEIIGKKQEKWNRLI